MTVQQSPPTAPAGAEHGDQPWKVPAICLVLAAITFAVFGQTLHHQFVNYDDDHYVYDNPVVEKGLTLAGVVTAVEETFAHGAQPIATLKRWCAVS